MPDNYNTWDDGNIKWFTVNKNNAGNNLNNYSGDDLKIIEGLICADVVITIATMSFNVNKGKKEIDVLFENITSIDISGNLMILNTIDDIPYGLVFLTIDDVTSVEDRFFKVMNGNNDPGCI